MLKKGTPQQTARHRKKKRKEASFRFFFLLRYCPGEEWSRAELAWGVLGRGPVSPLDIAQSLSSLRTAMKASVGTWTVPRFRIFFLPSFCFSSSFFLRVMSPP